MRTLIATAFISLDGVIEGPGDTAGPERVRGLCGRPSPDGRDRGGGGLELLGVLQGRVGDLVGGGEQRDAGKCCVGATISF